MELTLNKSLLSMDFECCAIGVFPQASFQGQELEDGRILCSNSFYFIIGTQKYYAIVPIEIVFEQEQSFEFDSFVEYIKDTKFYYISHLLLLDMKTLCSDKILNFKLNFSIINDETDAVYGNTIFKNNIINKYNYELVLPLNLKIKRFTRKFSPEIMKNVLKIAKNDTQEYYDLNGKYRFLPLNSEDGFVAHVTNAQNAEIWNKHPNTVLNRFAIFEDNITDENYIGGIAEKLSILERENLDLTAKNVSLKTKVESYERNQAKNTNKEIEETNSSTDRQE